MFSCWYFIILSCRSYVQKRIEEKELANYVLWEIALNTHEHWLILRQLPLLLQKKLKKKFKSSENIL